MELGHLVITMMEKSLRELNAVLKPFSLRFDCPICTDPHVIRIRFHGVIDQRPGETLWERIGSDVDSVTVNPSIDGTQSECLFHGWVRNGIVTCPN